MANFYLTKVIKHGFRNPVGYWNWNTKFIPNTRKSYAKRIPPLLTRVWLYEGQSITKIELFKSFLNRFSCITKYHFYIIDFFRIGMLKHISIAVAFSIIITIMISGVSFAYSQSDKSIQTKSQEGNNKNIIIEFTKAFNDRNLTAIDKLVAKYVIEHRPGAGTGIDATKGFLLVLQTAFPDFKTTLNHISAEGDKVVVFTNTTGTHKGPFIFAPGAKPTGKILSFQTADLYRIENGKIAEHWDVVEFMGMLQKMGAIQFTGSQK